MNRKIADIEWLRGVSILFVVIFHARPVLIPWPEPLWDHIAVNYVDFMSGVDIFLAVSGFVIARTLLPQLAAAHDATGFLRIALAFWVRRAWRLLPAAWLWLAIILVCAAIFNRSGAFQSFHTNFEATLAAMLSIANYRFGISWFRFDYGASTPYWSLSLEEQFYAALPFAAYVLRRRLAWVLILLLAAVFCLPPTFMVRVFRIHPIILGVLLAMASHSPAWALTEPRFMRNRLAAGLTQFGLLAAIAAVSPFDQRITAMPFDVIAVLSALLVLIAAHDRDYLCGQGTLRRVMLWLGSRSYAIYLSHDPSFFATREIWFRWGGGLPPRPDKLFLATALLLIFAGAELTYRLVERPCRRHGARIATAMLAAPSNPAPESPA